MKRAWLQRAALAALAGVLMTLVSCVDPADQAGLASGLSVRRAIDQDVSATYPREGVSATRR